MSILEAIAEPCAARSLARRYFAFHASSEAALAARLEHVDGLEFERRRRAPRIAATLDGLGETPCASGVAPPKPGSIQEALGFMYVVEGSSLGGRVIRRDAERLGLDLSGLGFLDPYGRRTGEMWRRFLGVLERHCHDGAAANGAVAGALAGFAHAEATLCAAVAPA